MHCKQIELMQNIFLQSQDVFIETPEAERFISEFMQNVETVYHYFNQKHRKARGRTVKK